MGIVKSCGIVLVITLLTGATLHAQDTLANGDTIRYWKKKLDLGISRLTGMELEVLKLVAHRGFSMKQIAGELSSPEKSITEHAVRKHLEHIYEKLQAENQAHAVCLAIKAGLIVADEAIPKDVKPLD